MLHYDYYLMPNLRDMPVLNGAIRHMPFVGFSKEEIQRYITTSLWEVSELCMTLGCLGK